MKKILWGVWGLVSVLLAGYYGYQFFVAEEKSALLIGATTYGHYQIEMVCTSCHSEPFGGAEVLQNACTNCHEQDLELAHDSHPKSKFTDPRNADRVALLDARYCVSCHTEHQREKTLAMGVTLPADFCFHCHRDIATERPTHEGMAFDSCAAAGCHNFHDNRALYEDFLVEHAAEPVLKAIAQLPPKNAEANYRRRHPEMEALTVERVDAPEAHRNAAVVHEWSVSAHARNGVNCQGCHVTGSESGWRALPGLEVCAGCHEWQAEGFTLGKHGMRLSPAVDHTLPALDPKQSPLRFKGADPIEPHSCQSCHGAHTFDTRTAAVEACLDCHSDSHSLAYRDSPHHRLWQRELAGELPAGSGVTCATCHMPREVDMKGGVEMVQVQHNQNMYLRPNEKMIRPVCMQCHGLGFAIDALADGTLIENNFRGRPSRHVPSIDMAVDRGKKILKTKRRRP